MTGSIDYGYTADGTKLCVIHNIDSIQGNSIRTITRYVGNKIFENGHLRRILLDEGYIEDGKYYFYLTDYLGNNRAVAGPDSIIQQVHYYPYGLSYAESVGMEVQPYKFGGKEYDKTAGLNIYDFGARWYEPDLGRFMTLDPMCEKAYSLSPYHYCSNNPVSRVDPTGQYDSPIYDTDGRLLGTDDEGLQGEAIFMDRKKFRQGMSHDEALLYNLGKDALVSDEARMRFNASYGGLSRRPDYDGKLTYVKCNSELIIFTNKRANKNLLLFE